MRRRRGSLRKGSDAAGNLTMRAQVAADFNGSPDFAEAGETWAIKYGLDGELLWRDDGSEGRDYVRALGQIWAEVRTTRTGSSATYWHHVDHLGTTEAMSDA